MNTIEVNLLSPEFAPEKPYSVRNISFLVISFCILVFLAFNAYQLINYENNLKHQQQTLAIAVNNFGPMKQKVELLRKQLALLQSRYRYLVGVSSRRITWSDKLSQILVLVPAHVWLSEIAAQTENIRLPASQQQQTAKTNVGAKGTASQTAMTSSVTLHITGQAEDIADIAKFIADLEALPFLEKAHFSSISEKEQNGRALMQFEVVTRLIAVRDGT